MKKHTLILLTLLLLPPAARQAAADSEVVVVAKGATADNVTLSLPTRKLTGIDGEGGVRLKVEGQYTGFCTLDIGRMTKMIYIEDGTRLTVTHLRHQGGSPAAAPRSASPYVFSGTCGAENAYLSAHELIHVSLPDTIAPQAMAAALNDSLRSAAAGVGHAGTLSPAFRRCEAGRRQYAVLNAFYRKAAWSDTHLPPLHHWMDERPELWMAQPYRAFFLDALYAIGRREAGDRIHDYTMAELRYAADSILSPTLRDAVLSHVMNTYMSQRGADDTASLMPLFLSAVTDSALRAAVVHEHTLWSRVRRGSTLPPFSFAAADGHRVSLSTLRGRYVLIDCWATWCGPCKIQLPHLERLMARYAGKPITFVGLSSDKKRDAWLKMLSERHMRGIQLNEPDAGADFFKLFRVDAIPRFILLSPDGTVYDAHAPRPSDPALTALLDTLLPE